jgi:hypothetical protein
MQITISLFFLSCLESKIFIPFGFVRLKPNIRHNTVEISNETSLKPQTNIPIFVTVENYNIVFIFLFFVYLRKTNIYPPLVRSAENESSVKTLSKSEMNPR